MVYLKFHPYTTIYLHLIPARKGGKSIPFPPVDWVYQPYSEEQTKAALFLSLILWRSIIQLSNIH